MPPNWSSDSIDFVNGLIKRKPVQRLGSNGPSELKMHPWFKDFNWEQLNNYKMPSPFKPSKDDNYDKKNSESEWKDMNEDGLQHCLELL